ncbi:hypothetical protein [Photobacterium lutimaris]|uniref:Uncharacterized protein n=1 Tax=Photobacterium lutimaris TaxID=388278 RepID=A0A2T3J4J4_9GAMM|nr:hypothetical protein [Photobacterium lutimaris]PSU36214.1 hypothetical protein C9I99_04225 [Photobacterium lutimaris]TDR74914.1 hypothetical protein DFP78_106245 [Photobacterium lutimaris]
MSGNKDKPWLFSKGDPRASKAGKKGSRKGVPNGKTRQTMTVKEIYTSRKRDPLTPLMKREEALEKKLSETGELSDNEWKEYQAIPERMVKLQKMLNEPTKQIIESSNNADEDGIIKGSALDDILCEDLEE